VTTDAGVNQACNIAKLLDANRGKASFFSLYLPHIRKTLSVSVLVIGVIRSLREGIHQTQNLQLRASVFAQ
jgi:hypothetical protein